MVRECLLIFGTTALCAAVTFLIKGKEKVPPVVCDTQTISAEEICLHTVINDLRNDVIWIDARSRDDWQRNGIKNSLLITNHPAENFDLLLEAAAEKIASGKPIIVYCSDAGCGTSKEIAKRIKATGLNPHVHALHGGYAALQQMHLTTEPSR